MVILKTLLSKLIKCKSAAHVSAMQLVLVIQKNTHRVTVMLSCHASDG